MIACHRCIKKELQTIPRPIKHQWYQVSNHGFDVLLEILLDDSLAMLLVLSSPSKGLLLARSYKKFSVALSAVIPERAKV